MTSIENLERHKVPVIDFYCCIAFKNSNPALKLLYSKQFPGKPAAEVSYKNKLTYRSVHVLSKMRILQSNARAPDF